MPESKRAIHTDLAKLDAHEVQPEEYEDIPELTDEFFDNAEIRLGEKLIRPGRPQSENAKKLVSLRLDPDIIERFRVEALSDILIGHESKSLANRPLECPAFR